MHAPSQLHMQAIKQVLRYLKGTVHHGLFLKQEAPLFLTTISNSSCRSNATDSPVTTSYLLYLGVSLVFWKSTRQRPVSRSSTEAEYRVLANATTKVLRVQNLPQELGVKLRRPPTLFCDNTSHLPLCPSCLSFSNEACCP
ncbi:hypothetical protein L6164_024040 [Bauhinia variegata]|uniref:Uncharacterized protein n=1 Tax=Bauhinia variegata TaxID=167791 RepID=A0ACB9LX66_BAUVA|nr:hypothetical protein L6164_024040 [Bauhinia variegata]